LPTYGTRLAAETPSLLRRNSGDYRFIVAGIIIIGLLGKFVAPGNRDNIPLWGFANTRRECILPPDMAAYVRWGSGLRVHLITILGIPRDIC
jgi:hypothetical protein